MIKKVIYDGRHFRSQIEARTAMLFDRLGIDFTYEPDCYELRFKNKTVRYLPDFYLTTLNRFVEIKNMGAQPPTLDECRKAKLLAEQNPFSAPCTILFGEIDLEQNLRHGSGRTYFPNGDITFGEVLTECAICRTVDFAKDGRLLHIGCGCQQRFPQESNHKSDRILSTLKELRMHRFWQ